MKKFILFTFLILGSSFSTEAQVEWNQFMFPNNVVSSNEFDVEVTNSGEMYVVYRMLNGLTTRYDLFIDRFSISTGWVTIYSDTSDVYVQHEQSFDISIVNDTLYVLRILNETPLEYNLLRVVGTTVDSITTTSSLLNSTMPFQLLAGENASDLYLAHSDQQEYPIGSKFNFGTNNWDAFTNFTDKARHPMVFSKKDSVYFSYLDDDGGSDKIYAYRTSKSNLSIGQAQRIGPGPLTYYNPQTLANDEIKTSGKSFFFGSNNSIPYYLSNDDSAPQPVSFPFNNAAGGTADTLGFRYGNRSDYINVDEGGYFVTSDPSQAGSIVVFRKDHATNTFTQYGPVVSGPTMYNNVKIASNNQLQHKLVSFANVDVTPFAYEMYFSNQEPTLVNSDPKTEICGFGKRALFDELVFKDLDFDTVFFAGVATSSNMAVMNPNNFTYDLTQVGDLSYLQIYCDVNDASISSPTNVTVLLKFRDGIKEVVVSATFTVNKSIQMALPANPEFCLNGEAQDLFDYVTHSGGHFKDLTNNLSIPNPFLPGNFTTVPGTIDVEYSQDTGCYRPAIGTFTFLAPPVPTLNNTSEVSGCLGNNGAISASVTSGTASTLYYYWNNGQTSLNINNLTVGTYVFNVYDDKGCKNKLTVNLGMQNLAITGTVDSVTCFGGADGEIQVTSATPLTAPLRYLWSNGSSTPTISNLVAGTYTVMIRDADDCEVSKSFVVKQSSRVEFNESQIQPDCGVANGTVSLNPTGGSAPYSYLWSNSQTGSSINNVVGGPYTVKITDSKGCSRTKAIDLVEIGSPLIYSNVIPTGCMQSTGGVNLTVVPITGSNNFSYQWSNATTNEDLIGVPTGQYSVAVTDDVGCKAYKTFDVNVRPPIKNQICLVDVDRPTNTNLVVWERKELTGVSHYNIYRESAPNEFLKIDSVLSSEISVFNDVIANPVQTYWRYRLAAVNECNVEGPPSNAHKTIHLIKEKVSNEQIRLRWDFYQGISYSEIEINFKNPQGVWIDDTVRLSSIQTEWSYFNIQGVPPNVDFDVAFVKSCTATGKIEDYNYSRSNRTQGVFNPGFGTGHSNNSVAELKNDQVSLTYYPNPVSSTLSLNLEANDSYEFTLTDMMGKTLTLGILKPGITNLPVSDLPKGVYVIRLNNQEGMVFRFIKE